MAAETAPNSRIVSVTVVVLAALLAAWAIHADDRWFAIHWMRQQCYLLYTNTRTWVIVARVAAAVLSVVLVAFVRPRAARVHPQTWIGILVAVVAAVGVCELYLRWKRDHAPPPPPTRVWVDHSLRHQGRQTLDVLEGKRIVHYATEEHGYRVKDEHTRVDMKAPSILVAGESVAVGFGLEWDESIAGELSHRVTPQVVNVARSGSSSVLTLAHLRTELPKFENPVAVVMFVVHTWLGRETDPRAPHADWQKSGSALEIFPPEPPTHSPLLELWSSIVLYQDDHRFDIARSAMSQVAALAKSRGAKPLFVLTECGARCISQDFIISELTRDLDAQWISVGYPWEESLVEDFHPSPAAARRYADAIERALRQ